MKILHICQIATPRVLKEVISQQFAGLGVVKLFYSENWHRDLMGLVRNQMTWTNNNQLCLHLQTGMPWEVYHVHTSINNGDLVRVVRETVGPDARVVWDCNDWQPNKSPKFIQYADCVICPSVRMAEQVRKHGGRADTVYSMVPGFLFPDDQPKTKIGATILVSGIGTEPHWRDYRQVQEKLGNRLFIMPGDLRQVSGYVNLLQPIPWLNMMNQIGQYESAYCGAANDRHRIDDCVTNKFWEAIASGLPLVLWRCDEMSELCESIEWSNTGWDDQNQQYCDFLGQTQDERNQKRHAYAMETQLPVFARVYTEGKK